MEDFNIDIEILKQEIGEIKSRLKHLESITQKNKAMKNEYTKLVELEKDFINELAKIDNNDLMDLFLHWQTERTKRSEQFMREIKQMLKK